MCSWVRAREERAESSCSLKHVYRGGHLSHRRWPAGRWCRALEGITCVAWHQRDLRGGTDAVCQVSEKPEHETCFYFSLLLLLLHHHLLFAAAAAATQKVAKKAKTASATCPASDKHTKMLKESQSTVSWLCIYMYIFFFCLFSFLCVCVCCLKTEIFCAGAAAAAAAVAS